MDIEDIKKHLEVLGLFSKRELETLNEVKRQDECMWCLQKTRCYELDCCGYILCMGCIENLYELGEALDSEESIFKCIHCEKECTRFEPLK